MLQLKDLVENVLSTNADDFRIGEIQSKEDEIRVLKNKHFSYINSQIENKKMIVTNNMHH